MKKKKIYARRVGRDGVGYCTANLVGVFCLNARAKHSNLTPSKYSGDTNGKPVT